jgi:hypothetical protein
MLITEMMGKADAAKKAILKTRASIVREMIANAGKKAEGGLMDNLLLPIGTKIKIPAQGMFKERTMKLTEVVPIKETEYFNGMKSGTRSYHFVGGGHSTYKTENILKKELEEKTLNVLKAEGGSAGEMKSYSYTFSNIGGGYALQVDANSKREAIENVKNRYNGKLPKGFEIWETMIKAEGGSAGEAFAGGGKVEWKSSSTGDKEYLYTFHNETIYCIPADKVHNGKADPEYAFIINEDHFIAPEKEVPAFKQTMHTLFPDVSDAQLENAMKKVFQKGGKPKSSKDVPEFILGDEAHDYEQIGINKMKYKGHVYNWSSDAKGWFKADK